MPRYDDIGFNPTELIEQHAPPQPAAEVQSSNPATTTSTAVPAGTTTGELGNTYAPPLELGGGASFSLWTTSPGNQDYSTSWQLFQNPGIYSHTQNVFNFQPVDPVPPFWGLGQGSPVYNVINDVTGSNSYGAALVMSKGVQWEQAGWQTTPPGPNSNQPGVGQEQHKITFVGVPNGSYSFVVTIVSMSFGSPFPPNFNPSDALTFAVLDGNVSSSSKLPYSVPFSEENGRNAWTSTAGFNFKVGGSAAHVVSFTVTSSSYPVNTANSSIESITTSFMRLQ